MLNGKLIAAILACLIVASPSLAGALCRNRSAFVSVERRHVEEVRNQFLVLSSLPFEVRTLPGDGDLATLQISYRRLTPGDVFSEPLAMELGNRVFAIMKDNLKRLGIRKIWAEFNPDLDC